MEPFVKALLRMTVANKTTDQLTRRPLKAEARTKTDIAIGFLFSFFVCIDIIDNLQSTFLPHIPRKP